MEKLAVIQSVYKNDTPEYLIKSIGSILSQTFGCFTYYIGIDGPIGQDLRDVLCSITDSRIVIIENKENKGLAAILNDLLKNVKKVIMILLHVWTLMIYLLIIGLNFR